MFIKKLIVSVTLIISLLGISTKVIADPLEIINPTQLSLQEQVEYFSVLYGTNDEIISKVIDCESKGNHNTVGDGGRSKGIAQFQKPTWDNLVQLYHKDYSENLNYKSQFDQIKLLSWSIANGYGDNWSTYRAIKKGGVYSFYSNQLKKHFKITCRL